MRVLILFAATMFAGSGLAETSEEKSYPGDKIKNLVLENGSGNLDIASHQSSDVTVTIEKRDYSEKNCKLTMKQDGAELLLKVDQISEGFFNGDCEVDFQVRVPQASSLNYALNLGAGNVTLNDLKGELTFNLGAGDLKANGIAVASLSGKSGAGNVDVKGTVEEGDISLGVGNATVVLTSTARGSLKVKTGTGNAVVNVPQDASVATDVTSGLGNITNQVTSKENAPYKVSVTTGIGNATLRHF